MIQNALHILGPVSALHLDPFLLVDSQPAGVGGYVMICRNDRGSGREYYLLCFDGVGPDVCVRLTPEARSFIGFDTAQSEYNRIDKGRVMVNLFTIDSFPMERFLATVQNNPCFKIRVDTLRRRQVEMLVRAYGSREVLAERNDFTLEPPRMEFQGVIPAQPLPTFAMGFGRGGFLLYRCAESEERHRPEGVQQSAHTESVQTAPAAGPGTLQAGAHTKCHPTALPAGAQPVGHPNPMVLSADVAVDPERPGLTGPGLSQAGATITPAGTFMDVGGDAMRRRSARPSRAALPTEPPDQLEFLSGSKFQGNTPSLATSSSRGNTVSPAAVSPGGSAQVREEDAPIPEIALLLQRLVDAFRKQAMSILGRKGQVVFESCERQLRKQAPQFRSDMIDDETAILAIDLIDAVVREAPLLKRSRLRGITLSLIADLYNKHFEVLNRRGFIPRVEEVYTTHKKYCRAQVRV
jgi:hypothetical protein